MGKPVGGDPGTIADGGAGLKKVSTSVGNRSATLSGAGSKASGGAGNDALTAALNRFSAATSQFATDLGQQLETASTLATSASKDLSTATGGPH
ncbi:MAG: hypothetical protein JWO46_3080 [Nocardioidaceae bacterium]|nr:hypothetical protein [Nocardioidaceae bacterium]